MESKILVGTYNIKQETRLHSVLNFLISAQTDIQPVESADMLCNSRTGVIKGGLTKTLKGDQEGEQ